jgi:tetratricopeptide (TPR) repeat protein
MDMSHMINDDISKKSDNDVEGEAFRRNSRLTSTKKIVAHTFNVFESLRQLLINTAIVIGIIVASAAVYKSATKVSFVVKDISVPANLQDQGITGSLIAQQILDHISEIDAIAGSKKQKADISGVDTKESMPSINLPIGGLSLTAVVTELKQMLGYADKTITGELFIDDLEASSKDTPKKYSFRLRIVGEGQIYRSISAESDLQRIIVSAAENIMKRFDPINLGYYYFRKKDYERADEAVDKALSNNSLENYPWAFTMHGLIAQEQGKLKQAIESFKKVIDVNPNFGTGYVNLSNALRLANNLDDAEQAAKQAIKLTPNEQDGYSALALVLLDKGEKDQALEEMKIATKIGSSDPGSYLNLGRILHRLEKFEEAIESFKKASELSQTAEPLIGAAQSSMALKKETEALSYLTRAANTEPKNFEVWMAYGTGALQAHEDRRALKAFHRALALAPKTSQPLVQISKILESQHKEANADALFFEQAREFANDPEFLIEWSNILLELGRTNDAKIKLDQAQAEVLDNPTMLETIAKLYESMGEIASAVFVYKKAIEADPSRKEILSSYIEKISERMTSANDTITKFDKITPLVIAPKPKGLKN